MFDYSFGEKHNSICFSPLEQLAFLRLKSWKNFQPVIFLFKKFVFRITKLDVVLQLLK